MPAGWGPCTKKGSKRATSTSRSSKQGTASANDGNQLKRQKKGKTESVQKGPQEVLPSIGHYFVLGWKDAEAVIVEQSLLRSKLFPFSSFVRFLLGFLSGFVRCFRFCAGTPQNKCKMTVVLLYCVPMRHFLSWLQWKIQTRSLNYPTWFLSCDWLWSTMHYNSDEVCGHPAEKGFHRYSTTTLEAVEGRPPYVWFITWLKPQVFYEDTHGNKSVQPPLIFKYKSIIFWETMVNAGVLVKTSVHFICKLYFCKSSFTRKWNQGQFFFYFLLTVHLVNWAKEYCRFTSVAVALHLRRHENWRGKIESVRPTIKGCREALQKAQRHMEASPKKDLEQNFISISFNPSQWRSDRGWLLRPIKNVLKIKPPQFVTHHSAREKNLFSAVLQFCGQSQLRLMVPYCQGILCSQWWGPWAASRATTLFAVFWIWRRFTTVMVWCKSSCALQQCSNNCE